MRQLALDDRAEALVVATRRAQAARAVRAALVALLLAPIALSQQSTTSISAVDGTDFAAAGGQADFSSGWVEFPGPPQTHGGYRSGHIAYEFSCAAPSTVAWQLSAVLTDGESDSVMLQVDSASEEELNLGWVEWHLGPERSNLEAMDFQWSDASASFPVAAGPHTLLIGEREVRRPLCLQIRRALLWTASTIVSAAEGTRLCHRRARRMACTLTGFSLLWEGTSAALMVFYPWSARAPKPARQRSTTQHLRGFRADGMCY